MLNFPLCKESWSRLSEFARSEGFEITSPSGMNGFNSAMLYYQLTLELVLGSFFFFFLALVFACPEKRLCISHAQSYKGNGWKLYKVIGMFTRSSDRLPCSSDSSRHPSLLINRLQLKAKRFWFSTPPPEMECSVDASPPGRWWRGLAMWCDLYAAKGAGVVSSEWNPGFSYWYWSLQGGWREERDGRGKMSLLGAVCRSEESRPGC